MREINGGESLRRLRSVWTVVPIIKKKKKNRK